MIKRILIWPDPLLGQKCKPVDEDFDLSLAKHLAQDLADTMYHHHGVGLAANQIGVLRRVFVADAGSGLRVFINPEVQVQGIPTMRQEGCLSFPGVFENTYRHSHARIRYTDLGGSQKVELVDGLLAHIVQHESEHLDGIVFTARMLPGRQHVIEERLRGANPLG